MDREILPGAILPVILIVVVAISLVNDEKNATPRMEENATPRMLIRATSTNAQEFYQHAPGYKDGELVQDAGPFTTPSGAPAWPVWHCVMLVWLGIITICFVMARV